MSPRADQRCKEVDLNTVVKASVALAILVAVLSLAVALTGLHQSAPMMAQVAFLLPAILLNIGCVFWALKQSATETGYLGQLLKGALIGVVAGVLIFAFSVLMLTALLPDYLDESRAATIEWIKASDASQQTLDRQIASVEGATAVSQSTAGLMGTFFTSVIAAGIIAVFLRRR